MLSVELWAELEGTYVGAEIEDNWVALFSTIDLFRKLALHVGESLRFEYPQNLEDRVIRYLKNVHAESKRSE